MLKKQEPKGWCTLFRLFLRVMQLVIHIVFEGLVGATKKATKTEPNATNCDWTVGCSCSLLGSLWLLVALLKK